MIKVGRITSALVLVTVGGLLLTDQMADTNYLGYLLDWWPLILILLGLEYLWVNLKYQKVEKQLRLDIGGVLIAVVIAIGVVGVTQAKWNPTQWFDGMNWESIVKGDLGRKFEMGNTSVSITDQTEKVTIDNPYGSVIIQLGTGNNIEIQRTVWVNRSDEEGAKEVAEGTYIDVSEGSHVTISSMSDVNRFARKPYIELVITVPERKLNWSIKGSNGKIEAAKLPIKDLLEVETTNASVTINDMQGRVYGRTSNGAIKAISVRGEVNLHTSNAAVTAQDITGDAELMTSNASITAERITGKLKADTQNGKVNIDEVAGSVDVETSNGGITLSSRKVGGDWSLETSNGKIDVRLPSDGSYEVDGRGNGISTNLPLDVSEKRITGKIGSGQYEIKAETKNAGISFQRAD
ncbi:MAG: putative adhesin [Paenibacillus sp.]|nr:putative adhesin [Paenibacillus sp.]